MMRLPAVKRARFSALIDWFNTLADVLRRRKKAGAGIVVALSAGALFGVSRLLDWIGDRAAEGGSWLYPTLLAGGVLLALAALAIYAALQVFARAQLPAPRADVETLHAVSICNPQYLRQVHRVVSEAFRQDTVIEEEVDAALTANPQATLGIYSDDEERIVGFASFWPMREEVAQKLIKGEMHESDIRRGDILTEAEIPLAQYAYIPAIAVSEANTPRGKRRAMGLLLRFRSHVLKHYFEDPAREITVFAFGYSEAGKALAAAMGLPVVSRVFEYGRDCPVFCQRVRREDVELWGMRAVELVS